MGARRIEQIVKRSGAVYSIEQETSAAAAAREMNDHRIGCLIVVDDDGRVTGIVTERDIVRKVVAVSADPQTTAVSQIMTRDVVSCAMQTPVSRAQQLMARHGMRHLPVLDDGVPVGMVSIRDIMTHELSATRAIARKQSHILQELETVHPGITDLKRDAIGRIVI